MKNTDTLTKNEFGEEAKTLFCNFTKAYSEAKDRLSHSQYPSSDIPDMLYYTYGYLRVLKRVIQHIKVFLDKDNQDYDSYYEFFSNMSYNYLMFRPFTFTSFHFGQYEAASFIYKQTNNLTTYMINNLLKRISK